MIATTKTTTMIRFTCASCGERLSVPEQYAGRKGVCPNCRNINRVPATSTPEPSDPPPPTAPAPAAPQRKATPTPTAMPAPQPSAPAAAVRTAPPAESRPEPRVPASDAAAPPPPRTLRPAEPSTLPAAERPTVSAPPAIAIPAKPATPKARRGLFGLRKKETSNGQAPARTWAPEPAEPPRPAEKPARREWAIDRRAGMPGWMRVTLFVLGIAAIVGFIWLFFYTLITAAVGK
jgi:hypothetical protein